MAKDGKLSLIGIFDRIFVTDAPARYPRFFVALVLGGDAGLTVSCTIDFKSPSGNPVLPSKPIDLTFSANGKANIITDISNLTLPEIGEYTLELHQDRTQLAKTVLQVSKYRPIKTISS